MRYISRIPLIGTLAVIGLLWFTATSFAADVATPADSSSLLDLLRPVVDAFSGGHYAYACALAVILIVAVIKRYSGATSWVHTDAGGSGLALVAAMATSAAAALAAPTAALSLSLLKTSALVGVGAAGGFAVLKNLLVEPILQPLAATAPAWLQPLFNSVLWIFDKPDPAVADTAAVQAGTAAVAAKPAAGVTSVTGTPTDVK